MAKAVDVVVIGLGPGGEDLAGRLSEAGLDVVGIDHELVGGECPYWGCVPSKMMIRAADLLTEGRRIPGMAGDSDVRPDWSPVAARIRAEATADWDDQVAVDRLVDKGVTFVRGTAQISGEHEVSVGEEVFATRVGIVVAIGTKAAAPPVEGLATLPFWSNREAVAATEVPESLLVLGGGAIGCEFAQVFSRFGATVTVVESSPTLVAVEEPEAGELLSSVFAGEGITVRTNAKVVRASHSDGLFHLEVGENELLSASQLLVATGRRTHLAELGVAVLGLDPDAHFLDIDEHCQVRPGLWAVGDVTGKGGFTHVSMYQSRVAAAAILGQDGPAGDYRAVPRVTFTDPEVGAVGMTEKQATDAGLRVRTGAAQIPASSRGWIHKAGNDGFIKIVEDADAGVLVGATSAGPMGGEVLSALALAVRAQVPVATLQHSIYAYPTFHRAILDALDDLLGS